MVGCDCMPALPSAAWAFSSLLYHFETSGIDGELRWGGEESVKTGVGLVEADASHSLSLQEFRIPFILSLRSGSGCCWIVVGQSCGKTRESFEGFKRWGASS
ncbi:hypothetical protein RDI58_028823 [Solanum bulbocastanum]|uniref:Uncharacterized protein n=1 Tax=Solanum bulbocastanum TaxID=147425 RepID=A0AAN8SQW3_SOLBU